MHALMLTSGKRANTTWLLTRLDTQTNTYLYATMLNAKIYHIGASAQQTNASTDYLDLHGYQMTRIVLQAKEFNPKISIFHAFCCGPP